MTPEHRARLREMYDSHEFAGYPDPLDLESVLERHRNLSADGLDTDKDRDISFEEFHRAWEWLEEHRSTQHWKGQHDFLASCFLANVVAHETGAAVSNGALIAAAFTLGLKHKRQGNISRDVMFKLPPLSPETRSHFAAKQAEALEHAVFQPPKR